MQNNDDRIIVNVDTECVAINVESLRKKLFGFFDASYKEICLDFANTRHMDAAGVGVIVAAVYEARRRGMGISMTRASGPVRNLLISVGFDRMLTTRKDLARVERIN